MLEKSVIELINRDLDGVASAEEQARLRHFYAENEEARRLAEDLRALSRGLAECTRAVPPPTLKPAVMRSLEGKKAAVHSRLWRWNPAELISVPRNLRPALLFAGGLAAGMILFAVVSRLIPPRSLDENDLVGSLAVHGSTFSAGRVADFRNGEMHASVRTGAGSGQTILRIGLDVPPGTLVVLAYNPAGGHVEGVDVAKAGLAEISLERGRVVLQGISTGEVGVLLSGRPEVLAGARLLFSDGRGGTWEIPLEGTLAR
jgi:hypothetical protein